MAVLARNLMDFPDESPSIHPCGVNDHIEGSFNLLRAAVSVGMGVAAQRQSRQAMKCFGRAVGMDRRQCSAVAGIHDVEQGPRLRPAYLSDDDAIRAMPEDGFQQVVKGDLAAMGVGL